ncbi:MAG TPA: cellulase family glycosylhydrolase, partial [Acidimicrobiales bacterium]|nr:cellulase family glycosylhydrolase [Acidimicrobiales bacterium]
MRPARLHARHHSRGPTWRLVVVFALLAAMAAIATEILPGPAKASDSSTCAAPPGTFSIAICGNQFVNQAGQTVVLRGVNTEGTQYDCAQAGAGFYDDPTVSPGDYTTEIDAMKAWGINVVRVNLNEQCWLAGTQETSVDDIIPATTYQTGYPIPPGDTYDTSVNAYMNEMGDYVAALNANGIYAELDLHLNAPNGQVITDASGDYQNPLPESYSDLFWKSVAAYFSDNHAVLFGVFNEPFPPNAAADGDTATGWGCDLNGCTVPDYTNTSDYSTVPSTTYAGEGMQQMIDDIRQYNTTAPLLVGGPDWAGDTDQWLATFFPGGVSIDPSDELAASVHIYFPSGNSPCADTDDVTTDCGGYIPQIAAVTPVVLDEVG